MEATLCEFGVEALADAVEFAPLTVRRLDGTIVRWTKENAHLYGWTADEAVGARSHDLLQTEFPAPLPQIDAELHRVGRWCGDLIQRTKDGRRVVVASRWRLHRSTKDGGTVVIETNHDITGVRAAEEALRASEAWALRAATELQAIYDNIPVGIALTDRGHRYISLNARMAELLGMPVLGHIGRSVSEIMPESLAQAAQAIRQQVLETGEPVERLLTGATAATSGVPHHWRGRFNPVRDPATGGIWAVCGAVVDVTERVEAERAKDILTAEMSHRVKNILALVHAIAKQTLPVAQQDPDRFARDFAARLQALARAHDLLTAAAWSTVGIGSVIRAALTPWTDGRIEFGEEVAPLSSAPAFSVGPRQAQALVLALHELATNAVKYGALSTPEGRLKICWGIDAGGVASLTWVEAGGPPPQSAPDQHGRGFGSRLLRQALPQQLGNGATVGLDFLPGGLQATLRFTPSADD